MRQYTLDRCREHTSLFAYNRPGAYTSYCAQRAYREDHRERDLYIEEDEQNPSDCVEHGVQGGVVEAPGDEGSAEEDEVGVKQVLQEAVQSMSSLNEELRNILSLNRDQVVAVPDVDIYDTGKAAEEEYRLFPNPTRKDMRDRLNNQVWNMLHLLQERVNQGTYHETDIKLIEGLQVILVLQTRLSVHAEIAIKHAKRPKHDLGI